MASALCPISILLTSSNLVAVPLPCRCRVLLNIYAGKVCVLKEQQEVE